MINSQHLDNFYVNTFQVTSVTFNDTAEQLISGGIDNDLKVNIKENLLFLFTNCFYIILKNSNLIFTFNDMSFF